MPSAVAMTDLGSCRLGNFNFKKLPLGKMPLGKYQTFCFIGHRHFLNVRDLRGEARLLIVLWNSEYKVYLNI